MEIRMTNISNAFVGKKRETSCSLNDKSQQQQKKWKKMLAQKYG